MAAIAVEQPSRIHQPTGLTLTGLGAIGFEINVQPIAIGLIHHRQAVVGLMTLQRENSPAGLRNSLPAAAGPKTQHQRQSG